MAMKTIFLKGLMLAMSVGVFTFSADAQKKPVKKRTAQKRTNTTRSTRNATTVDTAVVLAPAPAQIDSLPIQTVKKSLRNDDAIERNLVKIFAKTMQYIARKFGVRLIHVKK